MVNLPNRPFFIEWELECGNDKEVRWLWNFYSLSQVIDIFNLNQTPFPEIILEDDQVVTGTRG